MSRKAFWVQMFPINPTTGLTEEFNFTSLNTREGTGIEAGKTFYPYLENFPVRSYSVFDGEFDGSSDVSIDGLEISANNDLGETLFGYVWDGTRTVVYKQYAELVTLGGGLGSLTKIFDGTTLGNPTISDASAKFNLQDRGYLLNTPMLTLEYAGTGEYEGPEGYKGVFRPMVLGYPMGIVPILVNAPFLIYEYHGYGRTGGVQGLYENGLSFGAATSTVAWAGSVSATYAALKAVTLTLGQWADAPSIGMFRLGGEPKDGGVLSCDVAGQLDVTNTSTITNAQDVIKYVLARTPIGTNFDATSLSDYQTLIGGLQIADYFESQQPIVDVLKRWLSGSGSYYFFGSDGLFSVGSIRKSITPSLTIDADSAGSLVEDFGALAISAPYETIRVGGQKCFRVHEPSEISDALKSHINSLVNSDILSIVEKTSSLIPREADRESRYTQINARAIALGVTSELTATTLARSDWLTFRNAISPAWNNTGLDSPVTRTTFNTLNNAYNDALSVVEKKISEIDATLASWSGVTGNGKPEDYATKSRNLVLNGDAELGTTEHWDLSEVTGDTILSTDTTSRSGSRSLSLQKTSGTGAASSRAFPVTPGEKLVVRVSTIGSGATANGLYIRMQERVSKPSSGFVDGTNRSGFTDLVGNGPVTIGWTDHEFVYTVPSSITWVSLSIYSWSAAPGVLDFDNAEVFRVLDFSTGISGPTKPEDYATSADNMIKNGSFLDGFTGWSIIGTATWGVGAVTDPSRGIAVINPTVGAVDIRPNNGGRIGLLGAQKLYIDVQAYSSGGTGFAGILVYWYVANGAPSTIRTDDTLSIFGELTGGVWKRIQKSIIPPADATECLVILYTSGNTQSFAWTNLRVAKTQPAADVTVKNQITVDIPPLQKVAADYTGALTGAMPVVFSPIVKRDGVSIKSSDDVTYTITKPSDGTTGADGGTASVNNTGGSAAKGDVSVSAFATGSARVKFRLNVTVSGIAIGTFECTLEKNIAAAPSGGGSKVAVVQANQSQSTTTYAKTHSAANPQLVVASGEQLYASGVIEYSSDLETATRTGTFKNQYSTDNSTWNDFGSGVTGSAAREERYDGLDYYPLLIGSATINQNVSPGAGTYYVRSVFVISATGATITCQGNNVTFEAKV